MVEQNKPTLEQLKAQIGEALAAGDDTKFMSLVGEMAKAKCEIAKAAVEQAKRENEAMASTRDALAKEIMNLVKPLKLAGKLASVKALGFRFSIDRMEKDAQGLEVKVTGGVALIVPEVKQKRGGGGGGGHKTKDEYGMSLDEVYQKFATAEDKVKMEAAKTNSSQWQVKQAVRKAAIKAGLLLPIK